MHDINLCQSFDRSRGPSHAAHRTANFLQLALEEAWNEVMTDRVSRTYGTEFEGGKPFECREPPQSPHNSFTSP